MAAPTPASAGSATLDTTGGAIFDGSKNGGPCAAFGVTNRDSSNDIGVSIPGLHASGEFRLIAPGATHAFGSGGTNYNAITKVLAKAMAGTAQCDWGVDGRR